MAGCCWRDLLGDTDGKRGLGMGIDIDIVDLPRNLGVVVLCIAGFYWWRVSFATERTSNRNLKQAAFFTAIGFFLHGISLLAQAL